MVTKYFHSRYNIIHKKEWDSIISSLGKGVYDVAIPCELAVILGGYFENPSAFSDKLSLVFYKTDLEDDGSASYKKNYDAWEVFEQRKYEVWSDLLKRYFDEAVDLTGFSIDGAVKKIRETIETYKS